MRRRKFLFITIKDGDVEVLIKIKAFFIGLCYKAVNFLLKIVAFIFWPKKIIYPKKICIYRIGNIGDIICTIPAIIAVRRAYPDAYITLLTSPGKKGSPGAKELLDGAWFIDKLWVYYSDEISGFKKTFQFIKKMRQESFDLLIYFPQELITLKPLIRNLFFIKLCRIKKAIGFELSTIKFWTHAQSERYLFDNEVKRLINLLKRWDMPMDDKISYELPIANEIENSARKIFEEYHLNKTSLIFGFMPGASYPTNQWPLDNFIEVGKFILQQYPQSKIVVFGGPSDYEKGEHIKNYLKGDRIVNLAGKTSLLETAVLVKKLNLLVSNNTGLMHMAALAGVKTIAIFSAAELDGKWFPCGENAKLLMKRTECEGCYYKKCPYDFKCIKMNKPWEVIEIIKSSL